MSQNTSEDGTTGGEGVDYYQIKQLQDGTGGWKPYSGFDKLETPITPTDFARITAPDLECATYTLTGIENNMTAKDARVWTVVKKETGGDGVVPISKKAAHSATRALDVLAQVELDGEADFDLSEMLDARDEILFNLVATQE